MFDPLLADGITSGASEKLAGFVVKCLAVGGGFLVGYFLGAVVAWALDRWVFANKSPTQLKRLVSLAAGLALAILVALIVFGEGGDGLFGGRGSQGDGKGTPTPDEKGKTTPNPPETLKKNEEPPKKDEIKPPPTPMPGDMHVTILTGDEVKDGRFYLIDGDPAPKTLAEFKEVVTARRKEAKPELKQVIFHFKKDKLSPDHPAVRGVVAWLSASGIGAPFE
jgi:hypothetical protein